MANYTPRLRYNTEYESPIGQYRMAMGLTIRELCAKAEVSTEFYCGLQNGTLSPLYEGGKARKGLVKPSVLRLMDVLGVGLADLFPRYFCDYERHGLVEEQIAEMSISEHSMTNVDELNDRNELRSKILKLLHTLFPSERNVILKRFGFDGWDMTLREVADSLGYRTSERVRQLEARALRKLRHPSRSKHIRAFCEAFAHGGNGNGDSHADATNESTGGGDAS